MIDLSWIDRFPDKSIEGGLKVIRESLLVN